MALDSGFSHGQKANNYGGSNEMKKYRAFLGEDKNNHGDVDIEGSLNQTSPHSLSHLCNKH